MLSGLLILGGGMSRQYRNQDIRVGVIGLGYVGLPIAIEMGRYFSTIGFDRDTKRIDELQQGIDKTLEVSDSEFLLAKNLSFSECVSDLSQCNFFVVCVPTPVDTAKRPDLSALESASELVSKVISRGDTVVYESTVYPGVTQEICVPIIERASGLVANSDFFYGYSPERINPGDKRFRLRDIVKVTSGSNPETSELVDFVYKTIITAGTFKASSIMVAEAAKVIENTQRDVNIALVNELSKVFSRLDIDTHDVLEAASTKWNFLNFVPGLVGGHCIGVDPYYLAYRAQELGCVPELILAGRSVNDGMSSHVANQVSRALASFEGRGANKILILGLTFKENCPDVRNSKVFDVITDLQQQGFVIDVCDPVLEDVGIFDAHGVSLIPFEEAIKGHYDAVVHAVAHDHFIETMFDDLMPIFNAAKVVFDVKSSLPRSVVTHRL